MKVYGLPASSRLRGARAFTGSFHRRLKGKVIELAVRPSALPKPRLGVVVPKSAVAKAFLRNHLKRQVREWFRVYRVEHADFDVVVRVRGAMSAAEISTELDVLAGQLR